MVIHKTYEYLLVLLVIFTWMTQTASRFREDYACFINLLEISCGEEEVIIFESARYGRNDSSVAQRCHTPYHRNCDIDVTLILNRNCAGLNKCNLHVNTKLFGDPCGYEEFLIVRYQCVQRSMVSNQCPDSSNSPLYDHGYLASPNYPEKYYRDAQCTWPISVQQRQSILITIYDFELDVKRNGKCEDYLEISTDDRVYFKDCGAQGRQRIDVDASRAVVTFNAALSSLAQRGFFIYFEAIGPGCNDLDNIRMGQATYVIEDDVLYANVTCEYGYVFQGTNVDFMQLKCLGSYWNETPKDCVDVPPLTSPAVIPSLPVDNVDVMQDHTATVDEEKRGVVFLTSIILGIIAAVLLLSLLLIVILYYKKSKRSRRQEKMDQWRVVVNNLQDNELNELNDEQWKRHPDDSDGDFSPSCNLTKARRKHKQNNYDDSPAGKKLMYGDEEEYTLDYSDMHNTTAKSYYDEAVYRNVPSRRSSKASLHKQVLQRQRSGDRMLDHLETAVNPNESMCTECGNRTPKTKKRRPQSQRDLRYKRARSGQWSHNRSAAPTPTTDAEVPIYGFPKQLTQSAPDLMQLECPPVTWAISPDHPYGPLKIAATPSSVQNTPHHSAVAPSEDFRRATIGAPPRSKKALCYLPAEHYEDIRC